MNKNGVAEIIGRIVGDLKDDNEQYQKMVMKTIEKVMNTLGAADVDSRLEEQLIAMASSMHEDVVVLNAFGVVVNALGTWVKPYLPQICSNSLWWLNNKQSGQGSAARC